MTTANETQPIVASPSLLARIAALRHRRASWVLVDQGVASLGNFLTGTFLARYLPQNEYGAFGVLLETMLYLNSLQAALVIYPLTIKGATGDRANLGRVATASILFTLLLLPILGGAMVGATHASEMISVAAVAVAALVLWQLQETMRRALISDLRFSDAVWGDLLSYPGQAAAIFALAWFGKLSLGSAFVAMGLTSAAAIVVQSIQIGLKPIQFDRIRVLAVEFWRLGRWMLLTNGASVITGLGFIWTLKWSHGLMETAMFAALVQLFKLANPIMSSMSGLIVPAVARTSAVNGTRASTRMAIRYTAFGALLLTPYFLILALFPGTALRLLYGEHSPYLGEANLLRMYVANYVVVYFSATTGAWLAGLGQSRWTFHAQLLNIAVTLFIGLPLTAYFGVIGLIIGGLVSSTSGVAACAYYIHKAHHSAHHSAHQT